MHADTGRGSASQQQQRRQQQQQQRRPETVATVSAEKTLMRHAPNLSFLSVLSSNERSAYL
eukprot:SAG25_NODE_5426_length_659_cov_1.292857_1_plen_60_part_01